MGLKRTCLGIRSRVKPCLGHQDLWVRCGARPISPLSRESSVCPVSSGYESFPVPGRRFPTGREEWIGRHFPSRSGGIIIGFLGWVQDKCLKQVIGSGNIRPVPLQVDTPSYGLPAGSFPNTERLLICSLSDSNATILVFLHVFITENTNAEDFLIWVRGFAE